MTTYFFSLTNMRSSNRLFRFCSAGTSRVAWGFSCCRGAIRRARARRRYGFLWLDSSLFFFPKVAACKLCCVSCRVCACLENTLHLLTSPVHIITWRFVLLVYIFSFPATSDWLTLWQQACEMRANWTYICTTLLNHRLDNYPRYNLAKCDQLHQRFLD